MLLNPCSKHVINSVYFCGDGRYPIRRNSHHCSYDVIDSTTNKVVSFGLVDKCSNFHPDESFHLTSNMLESEAKRRSFNDLQDVKAKVKGFTVDGDNKNKKILEDEGLAELQTRDPNHLSICFNKYLVAELGLYKGMIPGITDCFHGLRDKIKNWYSYTWNNRLFPWIVSLYILIMIPILKSTLGQRRLIICLEITMDACLILQQILYGLLDMSFQVLQ